MLGILGIRPPGGGHWRFWVLGTLSLGVFYSVGSFDTLDIWEFWPWGALRCLGAWALNVLDISAATPPPREGQSQCSQPVCLICLEPLRSSRERGSEPHDWFMLPMDQGQRQYNSVLRGTWSPGDSSWI